MAELYRLARRLRRSMADSHVAEIRALSEQLEEEADPARRTVLRRQIRVARQQLDRQRDLADRGR